jgi:predicted ester cyclase
MASTSTEASRSVVERYFEALNGQQKTAERLEPLVGDRSLIEHVLAFEAGFPGYELLIDDIIAEGDKVVVRVHSWQRHDGAFMGFPPTGKEFSITGIIIYRVEDGRIAEHWMNVDTGALLQHLQEGAAQPVTAT